LGLDTLHKGHFGDDLPSQSIDWCKTPSLLNQSLG